ncbi:MAG: hypothetical protein ACYCY2_01655 [Acidithiobacillus ferriphilus]|jgi:hypothetical protein
MAAIANSAQDIFTKVSAIPALSASTGLTVGGQEPDPGLTKIPLPAAWVLFSDATNQNTGQLENLPPRLSNVLLQQTIMLHLPYKSQSDLITVQLPLLEAVINEIQGTTIGTSGVASQRWNFHSAKLAALNPDRLIYRVIFELFTPLN